MRFAAARHGHYSHHHLRLAEAHRRRFAEARHEHSHGTAGLSGGAVMRASYYSSGRRTASGEPFRPGGFTAANRTLPFGTRLRLTNPSTGRSVTVRVNDRGPFVAGRSLDVSRGAAVALGMIGAGTANLHVARL